MVSEASEHRERLGDEARASFLEEFAEAADQRTGDLGRWEEEGRIFGVLVDGSVYYPAFQLNEDRSPKGSVAAVISALRHARLSGWGIALWWVTPLESLGGARPVDRLDEDPADVVRVANLEDR